MNEDFGGRVARQSRRVSHRNVVENTLRAYKVKAKLELMRNATDGLRFKVKKQGDGLGLYWQVCIGCLTSAAKRPPVESSSHARATVYSWMESTGWFGVASVASMFQYT